MQTLIIHAVCFNLPSHQARWREQPAAIIMSSSIPMFSRLEMPGAQLSAVQKCPGAVLPGWQDHSGLQAAPQLPATRPWLPPLYGQGAGSLCLLVYVCLV